MARAVRALYMILLTVPIPSGAVDIGAWTELRSDADWSARQSASAVALPDSSIVLLGGDTSYGAGRDVWRSTDQGVSWTEVASGERWSARTLAEAVALPDGSIVLMSGGYRGIQMKNDVWRSTDQGTSWTEAAATAEWSARRMAAVVALEDGSVVIMGGFAKDVGQVNDVWRSKDQGTSWTEMTGRAAWNARWNHAAVALPDGSIVLMGGGIGTSPYRLNDVWRSMDQGASWKQMNGRAAWSARSRASAVALPDGAIVLIGGYNAARHTKDDVWRSTDNGASWSEMTASAAWRGRYYSAAVALSDGSIVLMGGGYGRNYPSPLSDVWRSTDKGISWTEMTSNAAWSARWGHAAVALPDGSIVLMGGMDTPSRFNDVWRSADQGASWTAMTWPGRHSAAAVALSDSSILFMGGEENGGQYNQLSDVWRSTDYGVSWTQMTSSAVWSGRRSYAAVALPDDAVVLMGGDVGTGYRYLNDVWRSTNQGASWTEMTGSAAWSARGGHAAVALPDGSIVLMGGVYRDSSYRHLNDVWRSTDQGASWTEMNSSAAWSARWGHAAVVLPDGSIVLMGGHRGTGGLLNDVWRSTDQGASWTKVKGSAAWTGRSTAAAVALPGGPIVIMGGRYWYRGNSLNDVWRTVCQGGQFRERVLGLCKPCPAGQYSHGGLDSEGCTFCRAGSYGREPGQDHCPTCPFPGRCRANNTCEEGTSGPWCVKCAPGYFTRSDQCVACRDDSLVPLVVGLLALFLSWAPAAADVFTGSAVALVILFVSATQLTSLYLSFSLQWPAFVSHFAIFLRSVAADAGQSSFICVTGSPFFAAFWVILGAYALALAVSWCRARWANRAHSNLDTARKLRLYRALVLAVVASYIPVARLSAHALWCTHSREEGVLVADPDVQCWSGWHTVYALLAIALLIALGLGIPCALLCSIQRKGCAVGHSASPLLRPVLDLLHEDRLPRFGAALLLRHAAVAVLTVLGERTPVVQLVLSALLSLATLVAVRRRRPWKSVPLALGRFTVNDGLNQLHTWSEGAQLFVLGLGVVVAALPASARAGVAAVACIACIACSASLVMAVVVVELGRRRRRHAGLSKQADPRNVVLELVEQGDYEQARAKGSDLGDDSLQSLVRVEIDLRGAADQLGRETEAGGASPTTQRAYQRLVARKLELMQQISPDPAEDPEEEELESEEASTQALERGVWNKAAALCQKWEALLAAWPPVQQASRTAASNALDAAASELVEQYSHARSILQQRRDAVAFSLGAIEASELDHTISALEEIVATHCAHCEEASTRLFRALKDEWEPLRSCDMDDPAVLERAVARVRGATALARDGFAALERVLEHLHAQGSRHDADRLRRFHRATNWLTSYTPTLEPPAEDVTAIAARRVQALVADVQDRAVQLTEAIQRAKAAGDWKEGLRLVGEVERLRERTRSPVASACAQACVNMKPDLAVEIMRLARRQSWDLALASPVGSAGSKVEQIQSEWAEVCAKTRQLTEDALGLTKSNDVSDLQRAQGLFGIVQEAYGRFAKKYRHIPRQLAGQGAFQAAKEVNELLKTADGKAGNGGRDGVEPQPSCSATAV